jgi:hypothetical protein
MRLQQSQYARAVNFTTPKQSSWIRAQLIFAPPYVLRATDIDAKQIRRADIVSGSEPGHSYDNNYSNRLFPPTVFCTAAVYSAELELCQTQNLKIVIRGHSRFYSSVELRLGTENAEIKPELRETI